MTIILVHRCGYSSSHLEAYLYFVFDSLLQNKGVLLKGFQVSCYKPKKAQTSIFSSS